MNEEKKGKRLTLALSEETHRKARLACIDLAGDGRKLGLMELFTVLSNHIDNPEIQKIIAPDIRAMLDRKYAKREVTKQFRAKVAKLSPEELASVVQAIGS